MIKSQFLEGIFGSELGLNLELLIANINVLQNMILQRYHVNTHCACVVGSFEISEIWKLCMPSVASEDPGSSLAFSTIH